MKKTKNKQTQHGAGFEPGKAVNEPQPKPKVRKVDYQVKIEQGEFMPGHQFCRAFVHDGYGNRQNMINAAEVYEGFGVFQDQAIEDFVRRNSSAVLNMVFDL